MIPYVAGHEPAAPAIIDAATGVTLTREMLADVVAVAAARLRGAIDRGLVFHLADNSVDALVMYLACLEAGCPVLLQEPLPEPRLAPLIAAFAPDAILLPPGVDPPAGYSIVADAAFGGYRLSVGTEKRSTALHPDLAVLLTTSGSTGSRKLVRLTAANLEANARSIVEYLGIVPDDRSAQTLPMHYSFGLSLVHSHLLAGAAVVMSPWSLLQREFWSSLDATGCTALAGVPFLYETMHRLRVDPRNHPTLRTLTQAGGGLRPELARVFHDRARDAGARFFVMYGQTEATARIAYVPWERLGEKIGSIGIAIPRGRLSIDPASDRPNGELIYEGPNVMMGYAESGADLALGDVQGGVLRTGDLADVDDEGFYFLRGRLTRFAKLFGKRVSLEDVEQDVERALSVSAAVVEYRDGLRVVIASGEPMDGTAVARQVARSLGVPPSTIRVDFVDAVPRTASGKKDYQMLSA